MNLYERDPMAICCAGNLERLILQDDMIYTALEYGHYHIVDALAECKDWTWIMRCACSVGHIQGMLYAVEHGGDIVAGLYSACNNRQYLIAEYILKHMDIPDKVFYEMCSNDTLDGVRILREYKHYDMERGFICACRTGSLSVVMFLISYVMDYHHGMNVAKMNGHINVSMFLQMMRR